MNGKLPERPSRIVTRMLAFAALAAHAIGSRTKTALLLPFTIGSNLVLLAGDRSAPLSFRRDEIPTHSSELFRHLSGPRRRLWMMRSSLILVRSAVLAVGGVAVLSTLSVAGLVGTHWWENYLAAAMLASGVILAFRQRVSYFDVARVVDRRLELKAQLGTAVELYAVRQSGGLASAQLTRATTLARELPTRQALSLPVPWRDIKLLGAALALIAAMSLLGNLGAQPPYFVWAVSGSVSAVVDESDGAWREIDPATAQKLAANTQLPSALQQAIDQLQQQLARNEITKDEYTARVTQVEDQIQQWLAQSAQQQQALNSLAEALGDTSATRQIADSINRGDYSQAAQELAQLGQQSGGLSKQARGELAERLADAAKRTAGVNDDISAKAASAAKALGSGNSAAIDQAFQDLAKSVADSGQALASQSDPAKALDTLANGQDGDQTNGGSPKSGNAAGTSGSQIGQGQQPGGSANGAQSGSSSQQSGNSAGKGQGAGAGTGERILEGTPAPATRPEGSANVLQLQGKATAGGSQIRSDAPSDIPMMVASSGERTSTSGSTGVSLQPVGSTGEDNYVPLELQPVVQDYFSSPSE